MDAELAHLHEQVGNQDKQYAELTAFLRSQLIEANKTIKNFDKNVTENCTTLYNQQVMLSKGVERNSFTIQ